MKTAQEINDEIKALEAMKESVRRYTVFGDDNWSAIETQIDALRDEWTDNDAYDALDEGDINEHEHGAALDAITWRDGYYEEYENGGELIDRPSLSWKSLVW
jgi:hypothetical protein